MEIEIRKAVKSDGPQIAASMREVDLEDIWRFGIEPGHLLGETIEMTQSYVGLINGELAVLITIQPISMITGSAKVGMVMTSVADEHQLVVGRYTKRFFEQLIKSYPAMYGTINPGYERSKKWLKWLGFEIDCDRFFLRAS